MITAFTFQSAIRRFARPGLWTVQRSITSSPASPGLFASTAEPATDDDIIADASSSSIYDNDDQRDILNNLQSEFLQTMRDRGFLHQCTNLQGLDELLSGKKGDNKVASAYLGFDATADSLHVGSLLQIMILRHFQKAGHCPVVLVGGGTSKVGDPTGKDESRVLLTEEIVAQNIKGISSVFDKFLEFADDAASATSPPTSNKAILVNNNDWLADLNYLEFLRDYGRYFTINRMLSFDSVKLRLARDKAPLSFLEFNYMILQSYDFLELHRRYNTQLQLGGSDQWGNMVSGVELGRRVDGAELYCLTAPLITTSDGKKMGKTANGAVWLNADRLSPYDYWQFWRNTSDEDVVRFLKLFTELPVSYIDEKLATLKGKDINKAKIVLADEATKLLHGEDCLPAIHETIENMFQQKENKSSSLSTEGLERVIVSAADIGDDGIRVIDLLADLKLVPSKKEGRRMISGGGVRMVIDGNETKITEETAAVVLADFGQSDNREVVLRAGKKRAGVVELQE